MAGKNMHVVHIYKGDYKKSSRLVFQDSLFGSEFVNLKKIGLQSFVLMMLRGENKTFIFHQQYTLHYLVFAYLLSRISPKKKHRFVYDMHDVYFVREQSGLFKKIKAMLYNILEKVVSRFSDATITVSCGLADEYKKRTGIDAGLVYNCYNFPFPNELVRRREVEVDSSIRAVYFGQISNERLPLSLVKKLKSIGVYLDLYGYVSPGISQDVAEELLISYAESGARYRGVYDPQDMSFLIGYGFSIMHFESSKFNIRYCMPNKLFQSLEYDLPCLVSRNMLEAYGSFKATGYVFTLDDFAGVINPDREELENVMSSMKNISKLNFFSAIGCEI